MLRIRFCLSPIDRRSVVSLCYMAVLATLLVACEEAPAPALPHTPTPIALALPADLLRGGTVPNREIATAGYLIADSAGAALVESVAFEPDGRPRPLETGVEPIWLGADANVLPRGLHGTGALRYATVIARGRLEGPGVYGARGTYHFQMAAPTLVPFVAQEATIGELLDRSVAYEGRLVRILGGLLVSEKSALLVDRLGAGGLPEPKARQVKLHAPLRDKALLGRLKGSPNRAVRFGQVQVEGVWRGGALALLSITIVT